MKPDYNNQHKYLDPAATNIPLAVNVTKWLKRLGEPNLTVTALWTFPTPLTGTPEVIQQYAPNGIEIVTYAVANLDVNNAAEGVYECVCTFTANNSLSTKDVRRIWVHVKKT